MSEQEEREVEVVTLKFSVLEAARLVEIMTFCKNSCQFLASQESIKGTIAAEEKYLAMSEDSGAIAEYVASSVSMGEPGNDEVH